jgi:hypothetical protein
MSAPIPLPKASIFSVEAAKKEDRLTELLNHIHAATQNGYILFFVLTVTNV